MAMVMVWLHCIFLYTFFGNFFFSSKSTEWRGDAGYIMA